MDEAALGRGTNQQWELGIIGNDRSRHGRLVLSRLDALKGIVYFNTV